jgi:CheY-like chemotaxis protein
MSASTSPDFRALFEAAPDPYLALAPDLTVVAASDVYLRATGTERAGILGRSLPELLNGRDGERSRALRASLDRVLASRRADVLHVQGYGLGGIWSGTLRLVHTPVYDEAGGIAYILHRVEEVPASGAEAAGERASARFLAGLAHDLRNPLAPIVNSLHISRLPNVSDEQREQLRELTERQVLELTRLIDDLLDSARAARGRAARERLDLVDLRATALGLGDEAVEGLDPAGEPLPERRRARREEAADFPRSAARRRILIVEDNADAASSLRLFLELTGHEVTVAHDGPAGISLAREHQPEVVLCDIGLPGEMDGYAVARALRSDPELSFIRLIALTGYGQAEDRRLASEAGFDLHLTKPTDPEALLRVLASFV